MPAPKAKRERTPFEKMTDLTRRLVQVPKAQIATKVKRQKRKYRRPV